MNRGSKLSWLWRAPRRALGRARDFYVRGLTGCARYVPADAGLGCPMIVVLPTSYSFGSRAEDDLRELIRAASQRRAGAGAEQAMGRSQSMAMARIDEDEPCEFGGGRGGDLLRPRRSRSCVGGVSRAGGRRVAALS